MSLKRESGETDNANLPHKRQITDTFVHGSAFELVSPDQCASGFAGTSPEDGATATDELCSKQCTSEHASKFNISHLPDEVRCATHYKYILEFNN